MNTNPSIFLLCCYLILLSTSGCEDKVVAIVGTGDAPFTLYGVLLPEADTQRVRVFPIQDSLAPLEPELLDALFISTDLTSGEQLRWTDRIQQEANGQYTHVFEVPLRVSYDHTYQLEVTRSDGAISRVFVHVPPRIELNEQTPILEAGSSVWSPVTVPLLAKHAPRLRLVELEYYVQVDFEDGLLPETYQRIALPYQATQIDDAWFIGVNLSLNFRDIQGALRPDFINTQYGIKIIETTLRMEVVNADWRAVDLGLDPELLAQPGVLENVENGFGFVGAGYLYETNWLPPEEAMQETLFRVD